MTDAQHARLPGLLREIVDFDRARADAAHEPRTTPVVPIAAGQAVREVEKARDVLRAAAREQYGRVPLRGDTGPGRPTAMAS